MNETKPRLRGSVPRRPSIPETGAPTGGGRWRFAAGAGLALVVALAQTGPALAQSGYAPAGVSAPWWKKCVAIEDDSARLACFDLSVPKDQALPAARRAPAVSSVSPGRVAVVTPRASANQAPPRHVSYRVSVGYGLGIGSHGGSFDVNHGSLNSKAGIGSDGDTLSFQIWADDWIAKNWSLGAEYLYINNQGKLDLYLPNGASVLTDPITAHAYGDVHGNIVFVNVAYRPKSYSWLRPYVGAGLGFGWGTAHADLEAANDFVGTYPYQDRGASVFGALQGFMGIEVPISRAYYVSATSTALWAPGRPFLKIHQRYLDFILGAAVGRRL